MKMPHNEIKQVERVVYIDMAKLEMLLAEELNQQEQDLNPPDNEEWNGVF